MKIGSSGNWARLEGVLPKCVKRENKVGMGRNSHPIHAKQNIPTSLRPRTAALRAVGQPALDTATEARAILGPQRPRSQAQNYSTAAVRSDPLRARDGSRSAAWGHAACRCGVSVIARSLVCTLFLVNAKMVVGQPILVPSVQVQATTDSPPAVSASPQPTQPASLLAWDADSKEFNA